MTTPTPENLARRLRRVLIRGRSRLGPRHNLFEPGIIPTRNWIKSNMNFVEIPLPSNSNNKVDFISGNTFKVGDEAVEYGKQKKKYMSLNSFNQYIKPRILPNGTRLRRASSPHMRTIYNTPPNSNNNMFENTHTREQLKRTNIRFVRFTDPSKVKAIKATIKQLEKELIVLYKTNTRPKILKTNTSQNRTKKYKAANKVEEKLQNKIENIKKQIKNLKEKLKALKV